MNHDLHTQVPMHTQTDSGFSRRPLWKITLRGIRAQFGRFSMTILAVLVGIAFLTSVLGLREVLNSLFTSATSASVVYDIYVQGAEIRATDDAGGAADNSEDSESENSDLGNSSSGAQASVSTSGSSLTVAASAYQQVPALLADAIAEVSGVGEVQVGWQGSALLYDAEGNLLQSSITLITPTLTGSTGPTWVEGHAAENSSQVAVEQGAAKTLGLSVGDTQKMLLGAEMVELEVVGIFAFSTAPAAVSYFAVDPQTAEELFGGTGMASALWVNVDHGDGVADVTAVRDAIAAEIGADYTVMTAAEYQADLQAQMDAILGFITTFLLVFTAVALFVGTFIIYNTFQMSVRARQYEFALLRALGTKPGQVFRIVAIQAIVIGIVGSLVGLVGGIGLNQLTEVVFSAMGMPLDEQVPLTWQMVVIALIVGTAVTLVSALIPARAAAHTAPVEAMRTATAVSSEKRLTLRPLFGVLLLALGVLGGFCGASRYLSWSGWALGIGAVLVLLSILVLSPALVRPVATVMCGILRVLARTSSRLALRNIRRNPRRMSVTSGALIVCIALVTTGATLARSVQTSMQGIIEDSLLADLTVTTIASAEIPSEVMSGLVDLDSVTEIYSQLSYGAVTYVDEEGATTPLSAAAVDPTYLDTYLSLPLLEGSSNPLTVGQVAVLSDFADEYELEVGDAITLAVPAAAEDGEDAGDDATDSTGDGDAGDGAAATDSSDSTETRTYVIGAIISSGLLSGSIILPYDQADIISAVAQPVVLFLDVDDTADIAAVKADIQDVVREFGYIFVGEAEDYASSTASIVNQVLIGLYALLGLSLVVAAIGIVNTLVLSVSERTREFGLLRAVGLQRTSVAAMIVVESVVTTVFGSLLGILTGTGLAAALRLYLQDQGLRELAIPWDIIGLTLLGAIVLGVVAAIIPALRAARVPVLQAIAAE